MKYKNAAFPFKAHNMYKTERAETEAEHNALEKKGYDHNPYSGFKKMDAMHNGKPGIQKEDFEQFSPMKKTTGSKAKGIDGIACWKGFGIPKKGPKTKMKGGKRVDNCKPL